MTALSAGVEALASIPACSKCDQPRWTIKHRGARVVVSDFYREHSQPAMFDLPAEPPKAKPKPVPPMRDDGGETLGAFHTEVRRRRLEREGKTS